MKKFFMLIDLDPAQLAAQFGEIGVTLLEYLGLSALLVGIGPTLIRSISFLLDKLIISFIDKFYDYFEILVNGTLLTDGIVRGMMDRVYIIVGVFVVFRLAMLLINYIMNPQEVLDEKLGVNSLIQRVIIGLALMILMPNIFGYIFELQNAVLKDKIIENIIMSDEEVARLNTLQEEHGMGKIIGMTIFSGFFSLNNSVKNIYTVQNAYDEATNVERTYDLSAIELVSVPGGTGFSGSGINTQFASKYAFDYFPIISTIALGFTLYMIVKYCLDAVVRSFKLSILQVISPIAIVEYMINKDRNEIFRSWLKATIACFVTLFIRVMALWFLTYVAMLMNSSDLILGDSLLKENDFLLKAIILLGLIALLMEFPKLFSDVFGLDLEQDAGVKNVLGKIGGVAKMAGGAAMMAGGAAIGGAVSRAKLKGEAFKDPKMRGLKDQKAQLKNDYKSGKINKDQFNAGMADIKKNSLMQDYNKKKNAARMGALTGMGMAAMSMTPGMQSARSGFEQSTRGYDKEVQKQKMRDEQDATNAWRQDSLKQSEDNNKILNEIREQHRDGPMRGEATNAAKQDYSSAKSKSSNTSTTSQATAEHVIELKEDTKITRDGSKVSLGQQSAPTPKLDNISTTSQATAEHVIELKEDTKVMSDGSSVSLGQSAPTPKLDNISTTSQATAEHVIELKEDTKVTRDGSNAPLFEKNFINETLNSNPKSVANGKTKRDDEIETL